MFGGWGRTDVRADKAGAQQDVPKANKTQPLDQRAANKTSFRPLDLDEFQNGVDRHR